MTEIWEFGGEAGREREGAGESSPDSGLDSTPRPDPGHGRGTAAYPGAALGHVSEPTRPPFPWPPAEGESALGAFGETWKSATFDPGRQFARLPRDGGTGAALLYYLLVGILVAGINLFWGVLGNYAGMASSEGWETELGVQAVEPLATFLLSPLLLVVGLFLTAAVAHLLLLVVGGARHGFGTTVRTFCYAYSPAVFAMVPLLGTVVGGIWILVLSVIGLRESQQTEGWKAALAVLLPLFLAFALVLVLALFVVAVGAALLSA